MLIEIKGVQFVNKGAELMLCAIIKQLAITVPEAEICLAHNLYSPYRKRAKVGAYQKINIRKNIFDFNKLFYFLPLKVRHYFKNRFGIVTEADVNVVLDASGFSYGDQWSDVIIHQVANEVARLKKHNKKYIFLPQSLGPFTREKNKQYAQKAFSNASLVFAREIPSFNHVTELLENTKHVHQAPDFTNILEPTIFDEFAHFQDYIILVPNSKMLSKRNKDQWWRDNYIATLASFANKAIALGEKVLILNHSGENDAQLCTEISNSLTTQVQIVEPEGAIHVKSIIARGKFIISSRFHGCVSALSQGIPCIATGWSHKYQELFSEYAMTDLLLPSGISTQDIEQLLESSLDNLEFKKLELEKVAVTYKQQSKEMWEKVFSEIK